MFQRFSLITRHFVHSENNFSILSSKAINELDRVLDVMRDFGAKIWLMRSGRTSGIGALKVSGEIPLNKFSQVMLSTRTQRLGMFPFFESDYVLRWTSQSIRRERHMLANN
jgi:hypothetical protein